MEQEHRENYDREAKAAWDAYQEENSQGEDNQEEPLPAQGRKSSKPYRPQAKHRKRNEEDDQANPHIERLLAGAGIVAAIVVVAVLIVVFSKLGAFFKAGRRNPGKFPDRKQPGRGRGTDLKGYGSQHAIRTGTF